VSLEIKRTAGAFQKTQHFRMRSAVRAALVKSNALVGGVRITMQGIPASIAAYIPFSASSKTRHSRGASPSASAVSKTHPERASVVESYRSRGRLRTLRRHPRSGGRRGRRPRGCRLRSPCAFHARENIDHLARFVEELDAPILAVAREDRHLFAPYDERVEFETVAVDLALHTVTQRRPILVVLRLVEGVTVSSKDLIIGHKMKPLAVGEQAVEIEDESLRRGRSLFKTATLSKVPHLPLYGEERRRKT